MAVRRFISLRPLLAGSAPVAEIHGKPCETRAPGWAGPTGRGTQRDSLRRRTGSIESSAGVTRRQQTRRAVGRSTTSRSASATFGTGISCPTWSRRPTAAASTAAPGRTAVTRPARRGREFPPPTQDRRVETPLPWWQYPHRYGPLTPYRGPTPTELARVQSLARRPAQPSDADDPVQDAWMSTRGTPPPRTEGSVVTGRAHRSPVGLAWAPRHYPRDFR